MRARRGVRCPGDGRRWAGVLVATLALTTSADAQVRAGAIRRATPDSSRVDSVFTMRVNVGPGDVMRLVGELMASREVEGRLALTLRDASQMDPEVARGIETQLATIARRNASLASMIRLQCARDDMMPDGYLGVNLVSTTAIETQRAGRGPVLYFFGDSTRIVSVDPGSPAQKAGLEVNDQVLAIGGTEVSKPIPLEAMLRPGAKLNVRVLRGGQARDVVVTVGTRTDDAGSPCSGINDVLAPPRWSPQVMVMRVRPDEPPASGGSGVAAGGVGGVVRARTPQSGAVARPSVGTFTVISPFASSAMAFFAGAQLVPLDGDWREMTGTDKGLLVAGLAPGSPAESAGLRKTDVITAVDDSLVTTAAELRHMLEAAGPNGVTLRVVRGRKPMTIVFRASPRQ